MSKGSRSLEDIFELIGTWVTVAGTVLLAIARTLEVLHNDSDDASPSSYIVDVRPVDPPRNMD